MLSTSEFHQALTRRLEMENGIIWASNIINNKLYLGAGRDAKNLKNLLNNKITHIINCADDVKNYYEDYIYNENDENNEGDNETLPQPPSQSQPPPPTTTTLESVTNNNKPRFTYLNLNIHDFGTDSGISRVFRTAADFVKDCLSDENNRVLIHCANGTNRSVTITIAVLMIINGKIIILYYSLLNYFILS